MTKQEAINLFGSPGALGEALGITRHAVYQWSDDLLQEQEDRVIGAAIRLGKIAGKQAATSKKRGKSKGAA